MARRSHAVALAGLVAGASLLLLPGLGRMGARDSTDARYLEVAREMVVSGNWLVPHLAGVAHLHKPPLAYWAAAIGFSALGVTPFAGRLLEQLALVGTAALLFWWAQPRLGVRPAGVGAGVFLTSGLVFVSSRGLHTDLFQLALLSAALIALFEGSEGRSGPTVLGFALLGASMLAKGPIASLVALAVVVPFLALRRERRLPLRGVLVGLALFAALGLPWYALQVHRDPSLLHWFAERQILARLGSGAEGHLHGAFYLPAHLLVGLLPWTPLVALALWRLRPRRGTRMEAVEVYLLLWMLAPCLLFELAATKLPTYLLPVFPAAALSVGLALAEGLLDDGAARRAVAASGALAGLAALGLGGLLAAAAASDGRLAHWLDSEALRALEIFVPALGVLGIAALALAAQAWKRSADELLPRAIVAAGATLLLGFQALAPAIPTHEAEARVVRSVPGARLVEYGVFETGMLFYTAATDRFFVAVHERLAQQARRAPEAAHLGLRREDVAALAGSPTPTFVLAKRSHARDLEDALGLRSLLRSRRFVLLGNPAAVQAVGSAPELANHGG